MKIRMTEKMIRYLLRAVLVIGTMFIFSRLLCQLSFPDSDYNFLGKDKRVELESGKSVTQVFTTKRDGLDQVKIILGGLGSLGWHDTITLALLEPNCETSITQDIISWLTPEPLIYYRFHFDRIDHSAEQRYCLKVTYFAPEHHKDRPYLAASDGAQFSQAAYFDEARNRYYEGRSLQIRPAYSHASFTDNLTELETRLSQYKPGFIQGKILLLGIAVIISSILLALFLVRTQDGPSQ